MSLIKLEAFKEFYTQLPVANQQALVRFVESQKLTNGMPESFSFEVNTATITFGQKEGKKNQMLKKESPICPPLDQQDFESLKDTQWQVRAEAIQNIQEQLDG